MKGSSVVAAGSVTKSSGCPASIRLRVSTNLLTSFFPLPPDSISCTINSRSSTASNTTSNISVVTLIFEFRIASRTFSILCVKSAISSYPIVADIPLRVCAALNTSLTMARSSGLFSNASNCSLQACKCSLLSSMNISKY